MKYLLDSNVIIAVIARADRAILRRMNIHRSEIGLSAIVLHELYFGAALSRRGRHNVEVVDKLRFPLIEFDDGDARVAGEIRAALQRQGAPIGPYDVLIAGQALARNLILITANVREFGRVEGLQIENWSAG